VRSDNDELWGQVGTVLGVRPGWSLQASSSPGAPPSWCLVDEGEIDLSVNVDGDAICIYVMSADREVRVAGTDEMTAWLDANEAASRGAPLDPGEVVDDLVHGKFTKWGHPGE